MCVCVCMPFVCARRLSVNLLPLLALQLQNRALLRGKRARCCCCCCCCMPHAATTGHGHLHRVYTAQSDISAAECARFSVFLLSAAPFATTTTRVRCYVGRMRSPVERARRRRRAPLPPSARSFIFIHCSATNCIFSHNDPPALISNYPRK